MHQNDDESKTRLVYGALPLTRSPSLHFFKRSTPATSKISLYIYKKKKERQKTNTLSLTIIIIFVVIIQNYGEISPSEGGANRVPPRPDRRVELQVRRPEPHRQRQAVLLRPARHIVPGRRHHQEAAPGFGLGGGQSDHYSNHRHYDAV